MKNADVLAAAEPNDNQPPRKENEPIVSRWKVDGSNYTHIYKDGKHFLTIKNYKVTEDFNSAEELKEYMENSWMELMTRTMVTMYGICRDIEKAEKDIEGRAFQMELDKRIKEELKERTKNKK